jgi:hypothetical protein
MSYLAVDGDEKEWVYESEPELRNPHWDANNKNINMFNYWYSDQNCVELPKGSIEKLIGKNLNCKDGCVKI